MSTVPAVHVLVDLENNQPTLDQVRALVPDLTDVWLFHSGKQNKHLESFVSLGQRQMAVPISRPGKNSLDFHLSFYLGYIAARNPGARLVVVAIDGGYAPMIEHAVKTLGFAVKRVSVRKPKAKKVASQEVKPAAKKAAPKKPASKKVSVKSTAAKKVPAKKAKAPAKKAGAKAAQSSPATVATKTLATHEAGDKALERLITGLRKMGKKAPLRAKAYRQHLKSMLGADATADLVDAAVVALEKRGFAKVDGETVKYDFASGAGG